MNSLRKFQVSGMNVNHNHTNSIILQQLKYVLFLNHYFDHLKYNMYNIWYWEIGLHITFN